jgi:peptidoglycan/LPS O-acetylase OafA/YrhL
VREERLRIVDLLRTLSILLVLAWHVRSYTPIGPPYWPAVARVWNIGSQNGHYGVTVFFVISGYLITRTTLDRAMDLGSVSVRDFYVRRIGRIVPLLALSVFLGAAILALRPDSEALRVLFRGRAPHTPLFWLSIFTFSFNWLRVFSEDEFGLHWDILWSLSIEEQFYLVFPWVLRWSRSRERLGTVLALVVLQGPIVRLVLSLSPHRFATFMNSFGAFEMIAMGSLLSLSSDALDATFSSKRWLARLTAAYGVVLFVVTYVAVPRGDAALIFEPTFLALGSTLFLAGGAHLPFFRAGAWRLLTMPGQMSYGMYLLHPLVFYGMWPAFPGLDGTTALIVSAFTTVGGAYLVFRVYERPANRWIRAWFSETVGETVVGSETVNQPRETVKPERP